MADAADRPNRDRRMADPLFQHLITRATQAEAKDHALFEQSTLEAGAMAAVYAERMAALKAAKAQGEEVDERVAGVGVRPRTVAMRGLLRYGTLEQADIDTYCEIEDADAHIRREADKAPIGRETYRPVSSLSRAEFNAAAKRLTDVRYHRPNDPLSHGERVNRVEGFGKALFRNCVGIPDRRSRNRSAPLPFLVCLAPRRLANGGSTTGTCARGARVRASSAGAVNGQAFSDTAASRAPGRSMT